MPTALLWVPGWNSQYTHEHIREKLDVDIIVVPVRNCSYEQHEADDYYREYHSDITEICQDIDRVLFELPTKYDTVFLYGHSRGGLASLLYGAFGTNRHMLSGVILSDPMMNLGKYTGLIPLLLNLHPLCWKVDFPYITLRPKIDVMNSFGKENDDFRKISEILSIPTFKIRQAGTFSDQLFGFLIWFQWLRQTSRRMEIPTYALLAVHDQTIETEGAFRTLTKVCTDVVVERCPFCTHDVLLFDGLLVDQIIRRMKLFLSQNSNQTPDILVRKKPAIPLFLPKRYVLWLPTIFVYISIGCVILSLVKTNTC